MDVEKLTRRQQLELWRKRTGRTPMKRLSYVKECWRAGNKPRPPPTTSVVTTKPKPTVMEENIAPQSAVGKEKPKLPRREKLEKWLETHGSTVKRPRSYLPKDSKTTAQPNPRPRSRRHSLSSLQLKRDVLPRMYCDEDKRAALKELFQKDIEDTISEVYNDSLSKQLEFDFDCEVSGDDVVETVSQQLTESTQILRSNIHCDKQLIFQSTAIRYTTLLAEPRRKRRHSCTVTPNGKKVLCLTPVRRSTRKSRNWNGPGVDLDKSMCFDSPRNAAQPGEDLEIQIIPNKALISDV